MKFPDQFLADAAPFPEWLNFLAIAGSLLLVGIMALVWLVKFRPKVHRHHKRRHRRRREKRPLNPTLAEKGGLPPVRKKEKTPDSSQS